MNNYMCDGNDTCIVITFFLGVLDLSTGLLRCCNGGHNKPILMSTELDVKPDLPLGVMEDVPYEVREFTIPSGAMLFLYTDGLTEAMNVQQEQFGLQRLTEQLYTGTNSKAQIEKMTQAVHQFVGDAPQSDDLTMLVIRYIEN
jgi:sigma-B regulation protein RsbU (phosphoserine phosphatase)